MASYDHHTSSTTALSVGEVIGRLGLARDSVYKLINNGQLPAKKIGRRTVIVAALSHSSRACRRSARSVPNMQRPGVGDAEPKLEDLEIQEPCSSSELPQLKQLDNSWQTLGVAARNVLAMARGCP
jgi:excisionase family DNA binding protein